MKVSVSLPREDVDFLDGFAREHGHASRSAALHEAVRMLRSSELGDAYDSAWQEFSSAGESELWDTATGDGVTG